MELHDRVTVELLEAVNKAGELGPRAQDIVATMIESTVTILSDTAKFESEAAKYKHLYENASTELIAKTAALRNADVDHIALTHERDDYKAKLTSIVEDLRRHKNTNELAALSMDAIIGKHAVGSVVRLVQQQEQAQIEGPSHGRTQR